MREREWQIENDKVELYGSKDSNVVGFEKCKKIKTWRPQVLVYRINHTDTSDVW